MEQHPIPRQITTFEFKLIGFLTLKQFLYLLVSVPTGFIIYKLFPVPYLNILLGILVGSIGAAFAFFPINDRPLDVWIKNFIKRMTSPTQYLFLKENRPLAFLGDLYFTEDPHRVVSHIDSQEKLAAYMATKKQGAPVSQQKQDIHTLLMNPSAGVAPQPVVQSQPEPMMVTQTVAMPQETQPQVTPQPVVQSQTPQQPAASIPVAQKQPIFTGVVKNHKLIPLPGILIYVKNEQGEVKRLLKTNPHGVFATFSLLPSGNYSFELKDPKNTYFFDTMKIAIQDSNPKPFEVFSKELL